jgi:hypothetical protein
MTNVITDDHFRGFFAMYHTTTWSKQAVRVGFKRNAGQCLQQKYEEGDDGTYRAQGGTLLTK